MFNVNDRVLYSTDDTSGIVGAVDDSNGTVYVHWEDGTAYWVAPNYMQYIIPDHTPIPGGPKHRDDRMDDLADWEWVLLESPEDTPNPRHRWGNRAEEVRPRFIIQYRPKFSLNWITLSEGAANFQTALNMVDRLDAADYVIIDTFHSGTVLHTKEGN